MFPAVDGPTHRPADDKEKQLASASHGTWRQIKRTLGRPVAAAMAPAISSGTTELHERLNSVDAQLRSLLEEVRELRSIADAQVDVDNQSTELLGRLLRSLASRVEELEERAPEQR